MSKLAVLSRETHRDWRWKPLTDFGFAAQEAVLPLTAAELSTAVLSLPLAFVRQGEQLVLVAVVGLEAGKNLLVAPDGRWLGHYVPASLRAYPFVLVRNEEQGFVLCFDESSALLGPAVNGERLFADDGEPVLRVGQMLNFLQQIEQSRVSTAAAVALLEKHACIVPWPIVLKTEQGDRRIEGVFQVDEAAFNALDEAAFAELRKVGAPIVAYCQLLSMQHLPVLGQLAAAHAQAAASSQPLPVSQDGKDLDLSFMSDGGSFNFSGL